MSQPKIRKAVIAAAGFGTRFLPQTKAMPKEMLPIVDKPIIQYVVEELVDAGIEDIVLVTGYHKRSIEDHFDQMSADLEANLRNGNKHELLEETKKISRLANFVYVRQKGPYGNATPLRNVSHLIGNEPFIYAYADDLFLGTPSRFRQTIACYEEFGSAVLPCSRITEDAEFDRYGIVGGEVIRDGVVKMKTIKEKPGRAQAPSDLASIAGYLLTPDIFAYLDKAAERVEKGKEFQVQPVIQQMMDDGKAFHAFELKDCKYYDTGNKMEYIKTVVEFALRRDDFNGALRDYLKSLS